MLGIKDELVELIRKHVTEELTEAEQIRLKELTEAHSEYNDLLLSFTGEENVANELRAVHQSVEEWNAMETPNMNPANRVRSLRRKMMFYAAASFLFLVIGIVVIYQITSSTRTNNGQKAQSVIAIVDKLPATEKARLTLADNSVIELDKSTGNIIKENGNTEIINENGELTYRVGKAGASNGPTGMNLIETPSGGFYKISLPDGSKVWLNAVSSLKYPVRFDGNERRVFLEGEAYFDVSKDAAKPFIVEFEKNSVIVRGTKFNIKAYKNEMNASTALEEGSVEMRSGRDSVKLRPNQLAVVSQANSKIKVDNADVQIMIAWTKGLFSFNQSKIDDVLRQVERWYGVSFEYNSSLVADITTITGMIERNLKLSETLEILERIGHIKFEMGQQKIIVRQVKP